MCPVIACDKREAFAQGSMSDEAIQLSIRRAMDCFAALAMTIARRHRFLSGFGFTACSPPRITALVSGSPGSMPKACASRVP
jgi:hypothetical protein